MRLQNRKGKPYINKTVSCSLRTNQTSSPGQAFTRENAFPLVTKLLVLSKHISNLSSRNTNISSRDISISANVARQFSHETDAEFADFIV
jgi:hypothetical protein